MSFPDPGTYNWTQFVGPLLDGLSDRMDRSVAFLWGSDEWELIEEARHTGREIDLRDLVEEELLIALGEIRTITKTDPVLVSTEVGRGAGGTGIAVRVIEVLDTYGGAAGTLAAAATGVRWAYRRLSEVRGHRVMVSLGAAEHLAAADLVDRAGTSDLMLVGSGDMQSRNHDRAFTGGDAFYVVLAASGQLHHYHVTAYGELTYIGTSPLIEDYFDASPSPPDWAITTAPNAPPEEPGRTTGPDGPTANVTSLGQ